MIERDYFINSVKQQFIEESNSMYSNNTNFILNQLNIEQKQIKEINTNKIYKGGFYFMFYDLQGKSSNMEKLNPIFAIDWFDLEQTRYLFAVSLNFIPVNIRTMFFNTILNYNLQTLNNNYNKDVNIQEPLKDINFINIYTMLKNLGFEWAIRKFDIRLINKTFVVSTDILDKYITMSTAKITGVDDSKLIQIWQKKITEQDKRQQKLINELLNNYKTMQNDLDTQYKTLHDKNDNLQKSLQIIKSIF